MPMEREMKQEVIHMNLENTLSGIVGELYGKTIREADNQQLYYALLHLCKNILRTTPEISGEKKVYYISAEFLIGRLLSNNLINLGIYNSLDELLKENGKELALIEEQSLNPLLETEDWEGLQPAFWIPLRRWDCPEKGSD